MIPLWKWTHWINKRIMLLSIKKYSFKLNKTQQEIYDSIKKEGDDKC